MSEENLYTFENPEYRKTFWHTSSHVMAQAVKRLWPEVQLAIGPAIDEGWYYDFDAPFSFTPEHLTKIEAEMKKIVKERIRLERSEKSREEAIAWAEANNEPYKKELIEDLPADAAQGDLYEVYADNSEWCFNGEKWFEYGKTTQIDLSGYAEKKEVRAIAKLVDYEISHKPEGTLVKYMDGEIRVMCPENTQWSHQQSGENADKNSYYIGFKAYAPSDDVVSFKEDLAEIISDTTMYTFEDNEFAGVDEYGRKYSIVWLPVAAYDSASGEWTYYGDLSSDEKYIGWPYTVEWYNANGVKVASDTIRINLSNANCHLSTTPFYMNEVRASLAALEESTTWEEI